MEPETLFFVVVHIVNERLYIDEKHESGPYSELKHAADILWYHPDAVCGFSIQDAIETLSASATITIEERLAVLDENQRIVWESVNVKVKEERR